MVLIAVLCSLLPVKYHKAQGKMGEFTISKFALIPISKVKLFSEKDSAFG